jgi:hypothetical protein
LNGLDDDFSLRKGGDYYEYEKREREEKKEEKKKEKGKKNGEEKKKCIKETPTEKPLHYHHHRHHHHLHSPSESGKSSGMSEGKEIKEALKAVVPIQMAPSIFPSSVECGGGGGNDNDNFNSANINNIPTRYRYRHRHHHHSHQNPDDEVIEEEICSPALSPSQQSNNKASQVCPIKSSSLFPPPPPPPPLPFPPLSSSPHSPSSCLHTNIQMPPYRVHHSNSPYPTPRRVRFRGNEDDNSILQHARSASAESLGSHLRDYREKLRRSYEFGLNTFEKEIWSMVNINSEKEINQ